jgi:hypothetical protein
MSARNSDSVEHDQKRRRLANADGFTPVDLLAPPGAESVSPNANTNARYVAIGGLLQCDSVIFLCILPIFESVLT